MKKLHAKYFIKRLQLFFSWYDLIEWCALMQLLHIQVLSVVGLLQDETDPMVSVMKVNRLTCMPGSFEVVCCRLRTLLALDLLYCELLQKNAACLYLPFKARGFRSS